MVCNVCNQSEVVGLGLRQMDYSCVNSQNVDHCQNKSMFVCGLRSQEEIQLVSFKFLIANISIHKIKFS